MKILLMVLVAIILGLMIFMKYKTNKEKIELEKEKLDFEKEKFYSELDFENCIKPLDMIINEEFDNYQILNLLYEEDKYISIEDQNEITIEITTNIYKRITPAILANLGYIYDVSDKNKIIEIISFRASLLLMDYVTKNNQIK